MLSLAIMLLLIGKANLTLSSLFFTTLVLALILVQRLTTSLSYMDYLMLDSFIFNSWALHYLFIYSIVVFLMITLTKVID